MRGLVRTRTLAISLAGHLTILGFFSLSFGSKIFPLKYASISFLGPILQDYHVIPNDIKAARNFEIPFLSRRLIHSELKRIRSHPEPASDYYYKPQVYAVHFIEKHYFLEKPAVLPFLSARKEPVIIFHPLLPYSFSLYFKDRQVAHVELMFNIAGSGLHGAISLERKISSGNLEVDLLCKRYISHYLFIQHKRFTPNKWQSVKIDLSARND